jgi:ATP-dependent protease ClpP protease subunit
LRVLFYTDPIEKNSQQKKLILTDLSRTGIFLAPTITPARTVRYIGAVTRAHNEQVLKSIERLMSKSSQDEIFLFVTSNGGPTGSAMSFFDTIRHILRPSLTTIGSGDVDSSAVLVFLSGQQRYVTKRTTLLLHSAGRFFGNQRYTPREMEAMLAEDRLKDLQYAALVAEQSRGFLNTEEVSRMMEVNTVLTPDDLVRLGLADGILA